MRFHFHQNDFNYRYIPTRIMMIKIIRCFIYLTTIHGFTYNQPLRSQQIHIKNHRFDQQQQQQQQQVSWRLPTTTTTRTLIRSSTSSSTKTISHYIHDDQLFRKHLQKQKHNQNRLLFQLPKINLNEYNRIYRRTIFQHDDWIKHRDMNRLLYHIYTIRKSIIYQTIAKPVRSITYISIFTVLWNYFSYYIRSITSSSSNNILSFLFPFYNNIPLLTIPMDPLVLTSPMLGLLLVFRTNTCYKRWEEGLMNWTKTKSHARNIIRLSKAMLMSVQHEQLYKLQQQQQEQSTTSTSTTTTSSKTSTPTRILDNETIYELLHNLTISIWMYVRSMKRQLISSIDDEILYLNEIYNHQPIKMNDTSTKATKATLQSKVNKNPMKCATNVHRLVQAQHRPNYALQDISYHIEQLPLSMIRKNEIHNSITIFEQCLGSNERILTSPVPLFYTRFTARFIYMWLAFCPMALYNHVINIKYITNIFWNGTLLLIPIMYIISMFLFGIDEIAIQCEEPFTILPLQHYCNEIYSDNIEIINFQYNDNNNTTSMIAEYNNNNQKSIDDASILHNGITNHNTHGNNNNNNNTASINDVNENINTKNDRILIRK